MHRPNTARAPPEQRPNTARPPPDHPPNTARTPPEDLWPTGYATGGLCSTPPRDGWCFSRKKTVTACGRVPKSPVGSRDLFSPWSVCLADAGNDQTSPSAQAAAGTPRRARRQCGGGVWAGVWLCLRGASRPQRPGGRKGGCEKNIRGPLLASRKLPPSQTRASCWSGRGPSQLGIGYARIPKSSELVPGENRSWAELFPKAWRAVQKGAPFCEI